MKSRVRIVIAIASLLLNGIAAFAQNDQQWLHMSVIGFEQAGASSTQADQRFFFDLYTTRPLPIGAANAASSGDVAKKALNRSLHWWGNVRVASYPQQINAPVGEFVTNLGTKVADVKVNEFAQNIEFRTGLDLKLLGNAEGSRFSLFAGFGGVGTMDPKQTVSIFKVPAAPAAGAPESIARVQFFERYSKKDFPGLDSATYVAFSSPDRSRFFRQYTSGLRYTQITDASAASVSASFGQHELVSGGRLSGLVGTFEGFIPFKLGETTAYVFGRALMSFRKNVDSRPVFLDPAIAGDKPVQPTDPGVYVISRASDRDVYAVGIGIDALSLIRSLRN